MFAILYSSTLHFAVSECRVFWHPISRTDQHKRNSWKSQQGRNVLTPCVLHLNWRILDEVNILAPYILQWRNVGCFGALCSALTTKKKDVKILRRYANDTLYAAFKIDTHNDESIQLRSDGM